jgi:hypothetical protein
MAEAEDERTRSGKGNMTEICLLIMAILTPFLTISAFVIGFNLNASKKILVKKPKANEKTEEQTMLERIDNAQVY